ncbi:DUF262 domain-containing protein [Lysobacter sp. A286]
MQLERRALDKIYKRRDRYEIPDWQREAVWGKEKKQKLIDTILRGWRLPKLYLLKTSSKPAEYEVLDGQQRLTAIWEFFDGDLELSEETAAFGGGARTYEQLPDNISDAFDDYELDYDEITEADEEDQKEFFLRLQEGLPLNSSEKLNAVHSKLRDFCNKLAKHKLFSETTAVPSRRYAYFDIAAKVMVIEIEGLGAGLRFADVKNIFEAQSNFPTTSANAKRAQKALDLLHKHLPHPSTHLRNRTMVQSVITMTCHLLRVGVPEKRFKEVVAFIEAFGKELSRQVELGQNANDYDYLDFQRTVNANLRSGADTRNAILLRKLFSMHPDLYSSVSDGVAVAKGVEADIGSKASGISNLIYQVNERYAAKNGKDLFKITNKTAKALTTDMGGVVRSSGKYKEFVEGLYFIFRESIGQRLEGELPTSFGHVNDLRTLNEHDVDHGKDSKVAKKRKALADTFRLYAGAPTPDSIDPSAYCLMQANILGALENDLRVLAKKYAGS